MRFDQHAIEEGINGTLRLMNYLKMIDWAPAPKEENRIVWSSSWVRAKTAGLFQAQIQCGERVNKGQVVGVITDPFAEFKEIVKSPALGYVVGLNNNPVVNAGDALLHLGIDNVCKLGNGGSD